MSRMEVACTSTPRGSNTHTLATDVYGMGLIAGSVSVAVLGECLRGDGTDGVWGLWSARGCPAFSFPSFGAK